jgi:hypothetical protein
MVAGECGITATAGNSPRPSWAGAVSRVMPRFGQSTRKPRVPSIASACQSCMRAGSTRAISRGPCAREFRESRPPHALTAGDSIRPECPCVVWLAFAGRRSPLPILYAAWAFPSWGITSLLTARRRMLVPSGVSYARCSSRRPSRCPCSRVTCRRAGEAAGRDDRRDDHSR